MSPDRPNNRQAGAWALLGSLALAGCAHLDPGPSASAATPFKPTLSVQDLMQAVVDPAADALWESVATVTTSAGTEEHRPHTDDDWAGLRLHAVRLAESANLLVVEGRPVAAPGRKLDDDGVPGVFDAVAVQQAIRTDRPGFQRAAHRLHAAGVEALAAIDRRDVEALVRAGGRIDQACESCHSVYWYPNAGPPAHR